MSNDPYDVTIVRSVPESIPPVGGHSGSSNNTNYTELTFPDNRPIVPPPSDTNVTYSRVQPHLQVLLSTLNIILYCIISRYNTS